MNKSDSNEKRIASAKLVGLVTFMIVALLLVAIHAYFTHGDDNSGALIYGLAGILGNVLLIEPIICGFCGGLLSKYWQGKVKIWLSVLVAGILPLGYVLILGVLAGEGESFAIGAIWFLWLFAWVMASSVISKKNRQKEQSGDTEKSVENPDEKVENPDQKAKNPDQTSENPDQTSEKPRQNPYKTGASKKVLPWIAPPILVLSAVVAFFMIGWLIESMFTGDTGYAGPLIFAALCLLVFAILSCLYSAFFLKNCRRRVGYTLYGSYFLSFMPLNYLLLQGGFSVAAEWLEWLGITLGLFAWCEFWALLGLLRYSFAKEYGEKRQS